MKYYLAKTDPQTYSIHDLAKEKETVWDGVHSFAAIKYIKTMEKGDHVFIYHSQGESAIVGLAEVTSLPRKNEKDTRESWIVDMKYICTYSNVMTLKQIKESGLFNDWSLIRQGRLSTMAAPDTFVSWMKKQGFVV